MGTEKKVKMEQLLGQAEEVSAILKSMAHPLRLLLLCKLSDKEMTVNELLEECHFSQSHVSQALTRLKLEGHISDRKDGRHVYYSLSDQRLKKLISFIQKTFCS